MKLPSVTISIDLELAWGIWDNARRADLALIESMERHVVRRLIEVLDRYDVSVTWAVVAALLDSLSASGKPGSEACWYAPDIIEQITAADVHHDIGSQGGRHVYYDLISIAEADDDLAFARSLHEHNMLSFGSFVFPRNRLAKMELLQPNGVRVFRGKDQAWQQRIRNINELAGRLANLADQVLPISPESVLPTREGQVVNLPGSMLFAGKNGLRRLATPGVTAAKLAKGIAAAKMQNGIFHLWFHPSNFYYQMDSQFALFEEFIKRVARERDRGTIAVRPMAWHAGTEQPATV